MDLAALTDLEWMLRDGPAAADLAAERERAVVRRVAQDRQMAVHDLRARIDEDRAIREDLALGWIEAVRSDRDDLPGIRIAHGLDIAAWILIAGGLALGGAASKALLAYDGTTPVNVLWFVVVLCVLQIAMLVLMLWFVLRARVFAKVGAPGVLHRLISGLASRFFGGRAQEIGEAVRALRVRRGLYADVERWTLFALAQRFGVAFNVGAIVVALATIAFSDLVFAWSTTLDVSPETVHGLVQAIALPWAWFESAVPSLDVVTASQWARMPGAFVAKTENAHQLAAEWWSFLIAGLVVWGLLPRLVAWFVGSMRARRALKSAGFDHVGYQLLFDRLLKANVGWEGPSPEDVVGTPPLPSSSPVAGGAQLVRGAPTWLLLWGSVARDASVVEQHVQECSAAELRASHGVGGADLSVDEHAIDAMRKDRASRVLFVAAAGQQPTADVVEFLGGVRKAIGAGKPIVVSLLEISAGGTCRNASEAELAQWSRSLGSLEDAHLWVAPLEVPS